MRNNNGDTALYSLAMLEINQYVNNIPELDDILKEPIDIMNRIIECEASQELIQCLADLCVKPLGQAGQYLKKAQKDLIKYGKRLNKYLTENKEKQQEFNKKAEQLTALINKKDKFIKEQLNKCFNFTRDYNNTIQQ